MEVLYFRTSHLGFEFPHFGFHYSFIIRKNEEALFVSGDAEMRNSLFRILKSHGRLKAAFFNPFVLVQKSTRDTVQKLNIEKKVIYHLPSEEYDPYSYRKSTIDVFSRHREELQGFELLLGDLEKVF